jgi:hypothetical protein
MIFVFQKQKRKTMYRDDCEEEEEEEQRRSTVSPLIRPARGRCPLVPPIDLRSATPDAVICFHRIARLYRSCGICPDRKSWVSRDVLAGLGWWNRELPWKRYRALYWSTLASETSGKFGGRKFIEIAHCRLRLHVISKAQIWRYRMDVSSRMCPDNYIEVGT